MSHKCRSGKYCVSRTGDGPAVTVKPNTICNGCVEDVERRRKELPQLVSALGSFIGRTPQTALQSKISRSMRAQPPLDVNVLSVRDEAEQLLAKIGNLLVRDLCRQQPQLYDVWRHGKYTQQYLDGVDLALEIRRLHRRVESMVGLAPAFEKRRAPCPRCGLSTLGCIIGSGSVVCSNGDCGWVGTDDSYQAHCLFKAEKGGA